MSAASSVFMRCRRVLAIAAGVMATLTALPAQAQAQSGRITGRVTDEGGQPLQGARITLAGTSLVTG